MIENADVTATRQQQADKRELSLQAGFDEVAQPLHRFMFEKPWAMMTSAQQAYCVGRWLAMWEGK